MKQHFLFYLLGAIVLLNISCSQIDEESGIVDKDNTLKSLHTFNGQLVYHNFTSYEALDSQMWLYDFNTGVLKNISSGWNITHPMNAHFSPDGKNIVFMGIGNNVWNVYLYDLNGKSAPENLTPNNSRDEDPKYSPDGKKIIFKRNGRLAEMNLSTKDVKLLSDGDVQYSMPYYNSDGTKLVLSANDGPNSSIVVMDISKKKFQTLYDAAGIQDYYPINANETSFYYSRGYSQSNHSDQVYRGFWNGQTSIRLPFNALDGDYSDAYPVDSEWVIISSTRTGTKGKYDLYMANANTGEIYSMSNYHSGINTSKNELGACVYIDNSTGIAPKIKNTTLSSSGSYYYASINFTKNEEVVISGINDIDKAYNRDFFEYNAATGKYKFTGNSGNWDVYYSTELNYIWVTRMNDIAPATYWIVGCGFSSIPRWYTAFNTLGWDMNDVKQLAYMKYLGNNKYQATIYLSDQTEWGFDIKMHSNRTWDANYAVFANNRITGDKKGIKVAGANNADIVMDSNFTPGYFRLTLDISGGLSKAKVNLEKLP